MNENILKDKVVKILMSWLSSHPDYDTQAFWSQSVGEKNRPPLAEMIVKSPHETYVLPQLRDFMSSRISPQQLHDQYNRPGDDGKVILHLMWDLRKKAEKGKSYSGFGREPSGLKELCEQWVKVLDRTDTHHWCWLDRPSDEPGEGLRRDLMLLLQGQPYNSVSEMANSGLTRVNKVYPAKLKKVPPSSSPWKSALRAPKVEALLTLGHKIDEPVQVGQLTLPAWEWLLINAAPMSTSGSSQLLKAVKQAIEDQKVEEFQQWSQEWEDNYSRWKVLNPDHRRATVGYVAKVLAFTNEDGSPCFDITGASPMDHLIRYREDLFPMFITKAMSMDTDQFIARYMQPDRAGAPALLRYYSSLSAPKLETLKDVLSAHGCWEDPVDLIRQKGGLFAWEQSEMTGWIHGRNVSFLSPISPTRFSAHDLSDPTLFFGDADQQKKWVQWWEKNIDHWEQARKVLAEKNPYEFQNANPLDVLPQDRFTIQAVEQMGVFIPNAHEDSWVEGLDPDLANILHVASCFIASASPSVSNSDRKSKWFTKMEQMSVEGKLLPPRSNSSYDYSRKTWNGPQLSRNPPSGITPVVLEWLDGTSRKEILNVLDGGADLPGRVSYKFKEERSSWETWVRRNKLMLHAQGVEKKEVISGNAPRM